MTQTGAAASTIDSLALLVGWPPIREYLSYIRTNAVEGQSADQGQLTQEWRNANDHVLELEQREAGWADHPTISALPEELKEASEQLLNHPHLRRAFSFVPTYIGIVELDRLVISQKDINLTHVEALKALLPQHPTTEDIFRFCLSIDRPNPPVRMMQTTHNSYSFISPSDDFRWCEPVLLKPEQILDYTCFGPVTAVLGLVVGYGSNILNALFIENRLLLDNGSHRAYALRELGITHVPCLIQQISRPEEFEILTSGDVFKNSDRYLKAVRPPVFKDYFDPALRKIIPVPRKQRLVRVSFGVETTDIPAN